MERKLHRAFEVAHRRLHDVESCRELFRDLRHDAFAALHFTRYLPAPLIAEQRICRHHVSAYTRVGSRTTRLCRSFAHLAVERAAVVLLHEALHYAGLPESPANPDALSSAAINQLVAASCDL